MTKELDVAPIQAELLYDYDKLVRDGRVAVLYSPGYGAGWSTWATNEAQEQEAMIFDSELVEAILAMTDEERREIERSRHFMGTREDFPDTPVIRVVRRKFPTAYWGGVYKLEVEWVPEGSRFEIEEYDGAESVRVFGPDTGFRA